MAGRPAGPWGTIIVAGFDNRRLGSVFAAGLLLFAAGSAAAAPELRAWDHRDEGQLVVDWGTPVDYDVTTDGRQVAVTFAQPLDAAAQAQLPAMASRLSGYLTGLTLSDDGHRLDLTLSSDAPVSHRVVGGAVILTISAEGGGPEGGPVPLPTVDIAVQDHDRFSRLVVSWPAPVAYELERHGDAALLRFDEAGQVDAAALSHIASARIAEVAIASEPGEPLILQVAVPQAATLTQLSDGGRAIIDIVGAVADEAAEAAAPAETPTQAADTRGWPIAPPRPGHRPSADEDVAAGAEGEVPAGHEPEPAEAGPPAAPQGPQAAWFDPEIPAAMAAFVRGNALWVVFAADRSIDINALAAQGEPGFGDAQIVPARGGVAVRYTLASRAQPTVRREGTAWSVHIGEGDAQPGEPIEVESEPDFLMGPRLLLRVGDADLVELVDPEVGDTLYVVPLRDAGRRVAGARAFVHMRLLQTGQGAALVPNSETVTVEPSRDGVAIMASGGLLLSEPGDVVEAHAPAHDERNDALFETREWRGPPQDFVKTRRALQAALADAPEEDVNRARLDLARFYFANAYGVEAAAVLRQIDEESPSADAHPQYRALRGAVRVLAGRLDEAEEDLGDPRLAHYPEVAAWRGVAAALREDWPQAALAFADAGRAIEIFEPPLATELAMLSAEAALRAGDLTTAEARLNWLARATNERASQWPGVRFLRGMIARLRGDQASAGAAWRLVADSNDNKYRVLAEMALLDLAVETGQMEAAEAAEALEALRYAWRGDSLEFRLLERLGNLHWQAKDYRDALVAWQRAVDAFPELAVAEDLAAWRARQFAELFTTDLLDGISPTTALSLFEDYPELVPEGRVGTEMIEHLAERLVAIDLLDRAADLLETMAETRLSGEPRQRVQTRVAGIRLLDGDSAGALEMLDELAPVTEAADIRFDQRLLRAHALAQAGRGDAALALLDSAEGLTPVQSALQRAARLDIAWRTQNWSVAAAELAQQVGPPPALGEPIEDEQATTVIDYGIALALADDRSGLDRLAITFGPAMESSPEANIFAIVTRAHGAPDAIADLATVRRQVTEVDVFQSFLTSYRQGDTPQDTAIR